MDHGEHDSGFDPDQRELCPDGACVGIIGPNGRCRVCGAHSPTTPTGAKSADDDEGVREAQGPEPRGAARADPREAEGDELDLDRRELCPDGACVGVIGPDGRCKVCRAPGSGKAAGD